MKLSPFLVSFLPDLKQRKFRRFYSVGDPVDLDRIGEFRNEAFPQGEPTAWLDRPHAENELVRKLEAGAIDAAQADACRFWITNGYLTVPGLIDHSTLDETWKAYEQALAAGIFGERRYVDGAQTLDDRRLDPHLLVPAIRALQHHPAILAWTNLLFGRKTIPFQTIMGHAGSQQRAHSDSIHMTTYPLGYLIANWIAFEDVQPTSVPLEYYSGSHRLLYLMSKDVGIAPHEFKKKGYAIYQEKYEPVIQRLCEDANLTKQVFLAKKATYSLGTLISFTAARLAPTPISHARRWSAIILWKAW